MSETAPKSAAARPVAVIGPFPPPVMGQAVATKVMSEALKARGLDVTDYNIGPKSRQRGIAFHLTRVGRVLKTLAGLAGQRLAGRAPSVYVAVDHGLGMHYTTACAAMGRLLGLPVFLHHHNNSYIEAPNARTRRLIAAAGPNALHISICPDMSRALARVYPAIRLSAALSNVVGLEAAATGPSLSQREGGPLRLGMLSNLNAEKGLDDAIATLAAGREAGLDLQLVLAGPAVGPEAEASIAAAQAEHGDRLDYRGPAYGPDKARFFADIDVFLFPTRYHNETQGIVNLEALAAGRPVIAYGRCCIPRDLAEGGGLAVPREADFAAVAVERLAHWAAEPVALAAAQEAAAARFKRLRAMGEEELAGIVEALSRGDTGATKLMTAMADA